MSGKLLAHGCWWSAKVLLVALSVLLLDSSGQVGGHPVEGLHKHKNLTDAQFTKILESIWAERYKSRILNRLHLSRPPQLNNSITPAHIWNAMPQAIRVRLEREQLLRSNTPVRTAKEAIFVAKPLTSCLPNVASGCFILDVVDDIPRQSLLSVTLQAETSDPRVKGRLLKLWEAYHGERGTILSLSDPPLASVVVSDGSGIVPVHFDLTAAFSRWSRSRQRIRGKISRTVVIRCENCEFSERSPVENTKAVLEIKYHPRERVRRQIIGRCGNFVYRCCTQRYILDFAAVGWSQWVVFPSSFEPNYCRGVCSGGTNPQTHHAEVMQILASADNPDISSSQKEEMMPCCSPGEMASMTLMYLNEAGNVRMQTLHNLIVTKCGCM